MPEGELLPKTKKSADWLAKADEKLETIKKYHSERNLQGLYKLPAPLEDDYSRLLSQQELSLRDTGMKLLRKERSEEGAKTMRKYRRGGKVRETGPAVVHRGEAVARKKARKSARSTSR